MAILFFGFIIMTHETGHFAFAKLFRVRVNEFSIGMGPALLKKKKKDTQYSLRLLPIGGYVAMEGEDDDSTDANSFQSKPPWKRGIIILAGAFVNILTGIILMAIILGTSDLIGTPVISGFYKNAASEQQGLAAGDKIVAVNDQKIYTEYDLSYFMMRDKDGVMDFVVERDGQEKAIRSVAFEQKKVDGQNTIVYDFAILGVEPSFTSVLKYSILDSGSIARIVWDSLIDLVTLNFSLNQLSGPIGTVDIMAETTTKAVQTADYSSLLTILAFIAINVGVFNLIPFPALDGGRFLFIVIEGIFRKPVSAKFQNAVNSVGMFLLFALMAVVTVSDIIKIV